jgi:hypothetical protein
MDRDLETEHRHLNQLTTILGNAQLLERRVTRSPTLAPAECEGFLRAISAIEQAAKVLHRELTSSSPRPEES